MDELHCDDEIAGESDQVQLHVDNKQFLILQRGNGRGQK